MRSTTVGVAMDLPPAPQIRVGGRILVPVDPFRPQESLNYLESWFHAVRAVLSKRIADGAGNPTLWDDFGFMIELPDVV